MSSTNPVTKIVWTFEDGQVRVIKGAELQKWLDLYNQAAQAAKNANLHLPWDKVNWKDEDY